MTISKKTFLTISYTILILTGITVVILLATAILGYHFTLNPCRVPVYKYCDECHSLLSKPSLQVRFLYFLSNSLYGVQEVSLIILVVEIILLAIIGFYSFTVRGV